MFFILLLLILLVVLILNSKIQIKILNLDFSSTRKEKVKPNVKINLGLIIFNKIEILKINLKKIKDKKIDVDKILEQARKIKDKDTKKKLAKELLSSLKYLQLDIRKLDLKIELGTEDAAITAILVGTIASILGLTLKHPKYEILPIYQGKNILNVKLDCIFRLNLIHYIYKTILKGRDNNERKSSHRRAYVYSHE